MKQMLGPAIAASLLLAPIAACAAMVDAALIPDGTYIAKVEKVQDSQHILIAMQNGIETMVATGAKDFSTVKPNDTIKLSLIHGKVAVYVVQ